jgi:hypothetical protein
MAAAVQPPSERGQGSQISEIEVEWSRPTALESVVGSGCIVLALVRKEPAGDRPMHVLRSKVECICL